MQLTREQLAKRIDEELLEAHTSEKEMEVFCEEAKKYGFKSVTILPIHVPVASRCLKGSEVKVDAAIGFSSGNLPTELRVKEVEWAVANGADELDIVMNISALKSGDLDVVKKDIKEVVKATEGSIVKAVLEVSFLTENEIRIATNLAKEAGAEFISTSAGLRWLGKWRPTGVEDTTLLRRLVGNSMKVKATGGIATVEQTQALIEAGADRIGTSSGAKIVGG